MSCRAPSGRCAVRRLKVIAQIVRTPDDSSWKLGSEKQWRKHD